MFINWSLIIRIISYWPVNEYRSWEFLWNVYWFTPFFVLNLSCGRQNYLVKRKSVIEGFPQTNPLIQISLSRPKSFKRNDANKTTPCLLSTFCVQLFGLQFVSSDQEFVRRLLFKDISNYRRDVGEILVPKDDVTVM